MADPSKILAYIATCEDKERLKILIRRGREQRAGEVEEAAFRRLVSLVPEAEPGTLEHDFWTMVHAFEQVLSEENGKTTRLSRTRQKVARSGIARTLQDWALGKETDGFAMLVARRMPELTGEAIVLRHAGAFPEEVVAAARQRLLEIGYEPPGPEVSPAASS